MVFFVRDVISTILIFVFFSQNHLNLYNKKATYFSLQSSNRQIDAKKLASIGKLQFKKECNKKNPPMEGENN